VKRKWLEEAAAAVLGVLMVGFWGGIPASAEDVTVTVWSHEVDSKSKVAWREQAARDFEKQHPGVKVKITWYQKEGLYAALKTALRSGQGPDAFYLEPDQVEYIENNLIVPLDTKIDWKSIKPWTREVWTYNGKTYALPQEVYTVELYYNKGLMKTLGIELPANSQPTQEQFLDIVKKAVAAGIVPVAAGVGNRPYPGSYILEELLLKKLGRNDYGKLLAGKLSYKDPRVVEIFNYVETLVKAGIYPKSFTTLKLSETFGYFDTKPGSLMMVMGSFYGPRTFEMADSGGPSNDFQLGIMQLPSVQGGACNNCKTAAVGASFAINAASKNVELAAGFLNLMAKPEMGALWLKNIRLQTATETGAVEFDNPKAAAYFNTLINLSKGAEFFIGIPIEHLKGQCKETFIQVTNTAFPAGLLSVDQATEMLDKACYKP